MAFLLFFFNRNKNANSIFLFLLLLFIAIHGVLQSSIMNKGPLTLIVIFFNNFSPLYFLIGPMLYFYVRGTLTDRSSLSKKDLLHFIPAAIVLMNVMPYWFTSWKYKYSVGLDISKSLNTVRTFDDNWLIPSSVNFTVRGALILIYVFASIFLLFRSRLKNSEKKLIPEDQRRVTYAWLNILVICMLLATIGYYMSALILILSPAPENGMAYSFFVTFNYICFIPLLIIPLALLFFPQILYGIPILRVSGDHKASVVSINGSTEQKLIPVEKNHEQKEELPVTDEQIEEGLVESAQTIMEYIKNEKPYLDKDFSMDKLAQAMQLPRHHIYFCMNRVLKVKFPELRKQLRIQHARHLLEEGKNKTLSIEGIGIQSGFSSRSNFFTAFKSEVGCTPSEYLERLSAG